MGQALPGCHRLAHQRLGGEDNTSAAERSIIRRASVMTVELERMETQFALAGEASAEALDVYARISSNLRRMLEAVGLRATRQGRAVAWPINPRRPSITTIKRE